MAIGIARLGALAAGVVLLAATPSRAGNVDPAGDGSRYAHGENVGWIDANPLGNGGPGALVADFELTGWMWSESLGWISLSCKNRNACEPSRWGVRNDGSGHLGGWAWSENAGWIDFGPAVAGVAIDPATGVFAGRAWGENVGWISFGSSGPYPYRMVTAWRCSPPPVPAGTPGLTVAKSADTAVLGWSGPAGATGYDVVRGSLSALRSAGGFAAATDGCLANDTTFMTLRDPGTPDPGDGTWYLVRGVNCGGAGTYDTDAPSQAAPRDGAIAASGHACP